MKVTKIFLALIFSCIAVLVSFFFLQETSNASNSEKDSPKRKVYAAVIEDNKDQSLFENGKFLEFKPENHEEEKQNTNSEKSEAEIERENAILIERFKELAAQFPNNEVIPRNYSKEELEKKQARERRVAELSEKLLEGSELNKEEKKFLYTEKLKSSKDKLELLEFSEQKLKPILDKNPITAKLIAERLVSVRSRIQIFEQQLQ